MYSVTSVQSGSHISLHSILSEATVAPAFGTLHLALSEFLSYVSQQTPLRDVEIVSIEGYLESGGRNEHHFLVFELRRPGRKSLFLRLDRRPVIAPFLLNRVALSSDSVRTRY